MLKVAQTENEMGRLCGRLLAQAEIAQADAVSSVNRPGGTRITARYYDFCVAHPSKAYPEIIEMIERWTGKVDYGTGERIKQTLRELSVYGSWPERLSDQQKCMFAQGYATEVALLREERSERIREAIKRKEEKEKSK